MSELETAKRLARDVLTETLHGPVPLSTTVTLAQGVQFASGRIAELKAEVENLRKTVDLFGNRHDRQTSEERIAELEAELSEARTQYQNMSNYAGELERMLEAAGIEWTLIEQVRGRAR